MKFLDSNVVIYAYFIPRRELKPHEIELKEKSRRIIELIDTGERVTISVVNLSEIANVLKTCFSPQDLAELLVSFYTKENITIVGVSQYDYLAAINTSKMTGSGINDCLAAFLMKKLKIKEVYTFDEDFKRFDWVKIVQK